MATASPATMMNVVRSTTAEEGSWSACNRNSDGQGLSWGIIQWSQRSGSLGVVLAACQASDPAAFASTFGPTGPTMLAQLRSTSEGVRMSPAGGVPLWDEPWLSRFVKAGQVPSFKTAQLTVAMSGAHMSAALAVWSVAGVPTERFLALVYDTAVNQGTGAVKTVLDRFLAAWKVERPYRDIVGLWCLAAASRYRQTSPRDGWVAGGDGYWYKVQFGRRVYDRVLARQRRIADSPALADLVLA